MNGIQQRIAHHVSEDANRAQQLSILIELNDALGGAYHPEGFLKHVWSASITPWGNSKGYNISISTVASKDFLLEVKNGIEKKLGIAFKDLPMSSQPGPDHKASWRPNVDIYLGW